jgi:hypothetical protein
MFRPNCRAIFRLVFRQEECTIDDAFSVRDLALQELVKIILVCYIKDLRLKFKYDIFIQQALKTDKLKLRGWLIYKLERFASTQWGG